MVADQTYLIKNFGPTYPFITKHLRQLRQQHKYQFTGFSDMSIEQLIECTQLSKVDAENAAQRQSSEPILWQDSDDALAQFKHQLSAYDLTVIRGGRFFHVMGKADKGIAIDWLRPHYQKKFCHHNLICVALGDSQNDLNMLQTADIGIVIPNHHNEPLAAVGKQIRVAPAEGPQGWDAALFPLLQEALNSQRN